MPGTSIKWLAVIAIIAVLFKAPVAVLAHSPIEIFPMALGTSSVSTVVHDSATGQPISSPLALNSTVYDTATVIHSSGSTATGTVTYTFYRSGDCTTGTVVGTQVVTLNADGAVPGSSDHGPLTAADSPYAFRAAYSGDANYFGSTSDCEPIGVSKGSVSASTTVYDAATSQPIGGIINLHSTVYDTATLTHSAGPIPTGTVTYTFYRSGNCTTGTVAGIQVVTLSGGTVPHSADHGLLTAADSPYAFKASYSGDANYLGGASDCEPFSVAKGAASITTTAYDASTNQPISGQLPLGATIYDTSVIDHPAGPIPTGTVTYIFFRSGDCASGTVAGDEVVTLNPDGTVPRSADHGPLTAADGPYAFQTIYSGDSNYLGGVSSCEPLGVGQGPTSVTTTIYNASTGQPAPAALPANSTVYDTSVVHHTGWLTPTGTITYTFYKNGDCDSGTVAGTQTVTLNGDGTVPKSSNHGPLTAADSPYAFNAVYSGDSNYFGGSSDCESVVVESPIKVYLPMVAKP